MRMIFATHNEGKVKEMKAILQDLSMDVISAEEAGIFEDVEEDGETFAENAFKKAVFVSEKSGQWAIADDSGICIDALDGNPGVYSARWAGEGANENDILEYTLEQMKDVAPEKRQAHFISCIVLVAPDGRQWQFEGRVDGRIAIQPQGIARPKLPYDMIFIPNGFENTFAEMSDEEKNSMSHRGRAFEQLKDFFKNNSQIFS